MKIHNIVTCVNENTTYIEFIPLWSHAWKKITDSKLIIGVVGTKSSDTEFIKKIEKYAKVFTFPSVKGIDSGVQAKITRMILSSDEYFGKENCLIVDLDMIPLNRKLLDPFLKISEDTELVKWGGDHPSYGKGTKDYGKWPMDRTLVKSKSFKKIINPQNLNYEETIKQWKGLKYKGRESVDLPFAIFSDESLLRALVEKYEKNNKIKIANIPRMSLEKTMMSGRFYLNLINWSEERKTKALESGEIFEVHGIRPFVKNIHHYEQILSHLELKTEDVLF